ncbi:protease [Marinicrinis lubricantis]|uniref:Protease n=1 Tax=Marinicrinis lubricantis TaxID=2086470 RepID=A0ABW1IJ95_9BACL
MGEKMLALYWICFIFGILFVLITVLAGDIIGGLLDGMFEFLSAEGMDFLQPITIVGGLTALGGAGIMLENYTSIGPFYTFVCALFLATLISIALYFFYVKPMSDAENSTAISMQDLVGKIAEVNIPIPADGYGEITMKSGIGTYHEIAASFDGVEISAGNKVLVIDVKDKVAYVSKWEEV